MKNNLGKVLITGASGFVGKYLIDRLIKEDKYEIHCTKLEFEQIQIKDVIFHNLDLRNENDVENLIKEVSPIMIFHLAAQSSVKLSWQKPTETVDINVNGTINLLEAVRKYKKDCRVLLVGSSEEYGQTFKDEEKPLENEKCLPKNIYAITKNTQNLLGKLYFEAYNMNIIMTRSFNHFGPGQSPKFVISDFCSQVAKINLGLQKNEIVVGNLKSYRDFSDVRDVVDAYYKIILDGKAGETYNIGTGKSYMIEDILNIIISNSNKKITVIVDEDKCRPIEIEKATANIKKIKEELNWTPKYNIEDTINDTILYWEDQFSN